MPSRQAYYESYHKRYSFIALILRWQVPGARRGASSFAVINRGKQARAPEEDVAGAEPRRAETVGAYRDTPLPEQDELGGD